MHPESMNEESEDKAVAPNFAELGGDGSNFDLSFNNGIFSKGNSNRANSNNGRRKSREVVPIS